MGNWLPPIFAIAVCAVFALALYGWGRLAGHLLRICLPWPMTVCLGLPVVAFLGGIFNLLEIAYPMMLDIVVVAGLGMSGGALYLARGNRDVRTHPAASMLTRDQLLRVGPGASLILAVVVFQATFLTPPAAFNIHDDFETYLALPLRMLQTGTLEPGMFSYVGVNTFGAQAFLQGFVAAHWPVQYVDSVDALFSLALSATMILVAALRHDLPGSLALLSVAVLIVINPQYVNVSTLYIGSALLIFLLLLPHDGRDDSGPLRAASIACAIATGMIYATLVALKATFALVVAAHFVLTATAVATAARRFRATAVWCSCVVASGCFFLMPWFLIHAYKLLPAVLERGSPAGQSVPGTSGNGQEMSLDIFSTDPVFYGFGAGQAHYTALVGLAGLCAAVLGWQARSRGELGDPRVVLGIAGCLTVPVYYAVHMLVIGATMMGPYTALRYAIPVLIGVVPAAIVLAGSSLAPVAGHDPPREKARLIRVAALAIPAACVVLAFSTPLLNRAGQAMKYDTAVAFLFFQSPARQQDFLRYNRLVFEPSTKDYFLAMQHRVPVGEVILSYVSSSLHYDFARNRILDADAGGLGAPWLDFPYEGSVDGAAQFLRERGVSHVLWEYQGYAIASPLYLANPANFPNPADRSQAHNRLVFFRLLEDLSERSEILVDDGSYRLFRLN